MLFEKGRRSESEVIFDILSYAKTKQKKTRLMYLSNMPYNHFQKYLDLLLEKGLLTKQESNPHGFDYLTTKKGKDFLNSMEEILSYFKD